MRSTRARASAATSSPSPASSVRRPARVGALSVEVVAAEQDLLGSRQAHELDQAGQAPVGRDEPDPALAEEDPRARRADPPVARQGERQAGAGDHAVDRGDDGLLQPLERFDEVREQVGDVAIGARVVQLAELREVSAGAERAAGPRHDEAADVRPRARVVDRRRERVAQIRIDGVAPVGPVEGERQHPVLQTGEQRRSHGA